MAVYSMTGYGSGEAGSRSQGAHVVVELRSVNSRFLDLVLRLPDELRHTEGALRERLAGQLKRGKVELRATPSAAAATAQRLPAPERLAELAAAQAAVQAALPGAPALTVAEVLAMARSSNTEDGAASIDWAALTSQALSAALAALQDARAREGARLAQVLLARLARLRELTAQAEPLVPAVVARQQQRFLERFAQALDTAMRSSDTSTAHGTGNAVAPATAHERALTEATAFALRIDVAEELARLTSHLGEIERLLNTGGEVGKRLEFLIQELHREANTLGSKSAALELTQLAVEMKVQIEQMREQVQNVE